MERQWSGTDTIKFHILPQTLNGKETKVIKTAISKTAQAESQGAALSQQIATRLTMQNIIENKLIFYSSNNINLHVYVCMGHKSQNLYAV